MAELILLGNLKGEGADDATIAPIITEGVETKAALDVTNAEHVADDDSATAAAVAAKIAAARNGATAVLTASTTPAVDIITRYDATGANRTPTLPALSTLNDKDELGVQRTDSTAGKTVTFTCAGSDTFDSGGTTLVLSYAELRTLRVVTISGTKFWKVAAGNTPKTTIDTQIDSRATKPLGGTTTPASQPFVNVRDFGAVCDGTTDDSAAIQAALDYANTRGARTRVVFPASANPSVGGTGTMVGYLCNSTITVPGRVDAQMDAAIVSTVSGAPALIVGEVGASRCLRARHVIRVKRSSLLWATNADVGIEIVNHQWCDIDIQECLFFTVGLRLSGKTAQGSAYNNITLGHFVDNQVHIDLDANTGGWVNENKFYGGSLANSGTCPASDRTGIRITSTGGTSYPNGNIWFSPAFEIEGKGKSFQGTCVDGVYAGPGNKILYARHENPSPITVITRNASEPILFTTSYAESTNDPVTSSLGTLGGSVIESSAYTASNAARRLIFKADRIHKRAIMYNGTTVNVPGLAFTTAAATPTDAKNAVGTINANYLAFGGSTPLGLYISTATIKRFTVVVDAEPSRGGRLVVRAHDSVGAVITTAGTVKPDKGTMPFTTAYGGAFSTGSDSSAPRYFEVSDTTSYVFVGVNAGTNPLQIRSFAIYAQALAGDAATWLPWVDDGIAVAPVIPTAGTYEVGRTVYREPPAAGQPRGWVCTTAGTPGTWSALPNL